ncbi:MAG: ligase-associated DNA damage response endonuclease PdeM [Elainellaceae cyanobacterium]
MDIQIHHLTLQLLAERAVYLPAQKALLVADLHVGKSETFQQFGIPVSTQVSQTTLTRLMQLCDRLRPEQLFILGDWFHSKFGLVDEVLGPWGAFLSRAAMAVTLVVGNHDRQLLDECLAAMPPHLMVAREIAFAGLWLTHAPAPLPSPLPSSDLQLNVCGHVHPCLRLRSAVDTLRLPCFHWDRRSQTFILPSFGEFTGGYEMPLGPGMTAYAVAEEQVVTFEGKRRVG